VKDILLTFEKKILLKRNKKRTNFHIQLFWIWIGYS